MEPKQLERIQRMEEALEQCHKATENLKSALETMDGIRDKMTELFRYYGSEEWYRDRDAELPADVRAGVLSEDLVYDEITEVRDAAFQMLETATDILKNRI